MTVSNTSKAALQSLEESGVRSTKRLQIFLFIKKNPRCSRADISAGMGFHVDRFGRINYKFPLQTVCGRVNELLSMGAISEAGCKKDSASGRSVNCLCVGEPAV